jgi:hypothetical protein
MITAATSDEAERGVRREAELLGDSRLMCGRRRP